MLVTAPGVAGDGLVTSGDVVQAEYLVGDNGLLRRAGDLEDGVFGVDAFVRGPRLGFLGVGRCPGGTGTRVFGCVVMRQLYRRLI